MFPQGGFPFPPSGVGPRTNAEEKARETHLECTNMVALRLLWNQPIDLGERSSATRSYKPIIWVYRRWVPKYIMSSECPFSNINDTVIKGVKGLVCWNHLHKTLNQTLTVTTKCDTLTVCVTWVNVFSVWRVRVFHFSHRVVLLDPLPGEMRVITRSLTTPFGLWGQIQCAAPNVTHLTWELITRLSAATLTSFLF